MILNFKLLYLYYFNTNYETLFTLPENTENIIYQYNSYTNNFEN